SRDPLLNLDGGNLYAGYYIPRGTDPSGTSTWDYSDPPSGPFTTSCRIRTRCNNVVLGLRHCGLVIEADGDTWSIDGTGGDSNDFNWQTGGDARADGTFSNWTDFPPSTCECLR